MGAQLVLDKNVAGISGRSLTLFMYSLFYYLVNAKSPEQRGHILSMLIPELRDILKDYNVISNTSDDVILLESDKILNFLKEKLEANSESPDVVVMPFHLLRPFLDNIKTRLAAIRIAQNARKLLESDKLLNPSSISTIYELPPSLSLNRQLSKIESISLPDPIPHSEFLFSFPLEWGRTHVLVGHPGSGKTAFALNIARQFAQNGIRVTYFTLEIPLEEVLFRLTVMSPFFRGTSGFVDSAALRRFLMEMGEEERRVFFFENILYGGKFEAIEVERALPVILNHINEGEDGQIYIIDYINLLADGGRTYESIGKIMNVLTSIARERKITFFLLAQANRDGGVAESYKIVMDADVVALIETSPGYRILKSLKVRYGPTFEAAFRSHGLYIDFSEPYFLREDELAYIDSFSWKVKKEFKRVCISRRFTLDQIASLAKSLRKIPSDDERIEYLQTF